MKNQGANFAEKFLERDKAHARPLSPATFSEFRPHPVKTSGRPRNFVRAFSGQAAHEDIAGKPEALCPTRFFPTNPHQTSSSGDQSPPTNGPACCPSIRNHPANPPLAKSPRKSLTPSSESLSGLREPQSPRLTTRTVREAGLGLFLGLDGDRGAAQVSSLSNLASSPTSTSLADRTANKPSPGQCYRAIEPALHRPSVTANIDVTMPQRPLYLIPGPTDR